MISSRTDPPLRLFKADRLRASRDKRSRFLSKRRSSNLPSPRKLQTPLLLLPPKPTSFSASEVEMTPNSPAEEELVKPEVVLQRLVEERTLSRH